MVWFTQALEKKGADGKGCGVWHLTANSDEGGGFYVGCDHDHQSPEEAQLCVEARKAIGGLTGFPLKADKITINGIEYEWPHDDPLAHEEICRLAGQSECASVVYCGPRNGDSQRSGTTYSGKSIKTEDGMVIDCIVTGNA